MTGQWFQIEPGWLTWNGYHVYGYGDESEASWNADLRGTRPSVKIATCVPRRSAITACEEHAEKAATERREENGQAPLTLACTFRLGAWVIDVGTTPSGRWTVEMTCEASAQRVYLGSESAAYEYARRFGS